MTKHYLPIPDRKKYSDIFLTEHASKERKKRYVLGIFFLPKGQKQRDQTEIFQLAAKNTENEVTKHHLPIPDRKKIETFF